MPIVYPGRRAGPDEVAESAEPDAENARSQGAHRTSFLLEANIKAAAAQQQLIADVGAIEQFNQLGGRGQ